MKNNIKQDDFVLASGVCSECGTMFEFVCDIYRRKYRYDSVVMACPFCRPDLFGGEPAEPEEQGLDVDDGEHEQ